MRTAGHVDVNRRLPERSLVASVLIRAIMDLSSDDGRVEADAKEWIWPEEEDSLVPWTFAWCCQHVGIEPQAIRDRLSNMEDMEVVYRKIFKTKYTRYNHGNSKRIQ